MSQVTDWAAKEQADLTAISTTLDGLVAGIAALDTLITNLSIGCDWDYPLRIRPRSTGSKRRPMRW